MTKTKRIRNGDATREGGSPVTVTTQPRHTAPRAQPLEPFFIPKLQNRFADFPNLHCSISPEAVHLGDMMRLSVRLGSMHFNSSRFSRAVPTTPDTSKGDVLLQTLTAFLRVKRFEGPQSVRKKRQLFPEGEPTGPESFALPLARHQTQEC
jgi:hypothetical protein